MSRPVFEAGIGLTVIGAALAIVGIAFVGLGASWAADRRDRYVPGEWGYDTLEEYCEGEYYSQNCWHSDDPVFVGAFLGSGSSFLIPGILMMVLDRQRDATHTTSVAPASQ